MSREHLLDVADLEPPEPLERALEAIGALPQGSYVRMLHRREPLLLYPILDERGFTWLVRVGDDAPLEILIWRTDDAAAKAAVQACLGSRSSAGG